MLFHPELESWRCTRCGRLLARISLSPGSMVEQPCPRCHTVNYTRVTESAKETGSVASRMLDGIVPLRS